MDLSVSGNCEQLQVMLARLFNGIPSSVSFITSNYSDLLAEVDQQVTRIADSFPTRHHEAIKPSLLNSPITLILIALKISILLLAYYFAEKSNFDKLPGPKGIWPLGITYKLWNPTERLRIMTTWALQYRPCCAFTLGSHKMVFLTTPSSVQKLLSSPDSSYLNKSFAYKVFRPFWKDGLVVAQAEKWKERRKVLTKAFTLGSFVGYMDVYNKQSRSLVDELETVSVEGYSETGKGHPIDVILWKHALRAICEATMGTDIWEIEGSDTLPSSLGTCKDLCMMRILKPWLLIDWLWKWHPNSSHLKNSAALLDQFTYKVIEQRKLKMAESPILPFFGSSSETTEESVGHTPGMKKAFTSIIEELLIAGVDDEGVMEEVNTFVTAGYESTATSLQFVLFCMAINPKHQEICREEVDRVFDDVSLCPDGDLVYESLANLKYLERCIFETLRLFTVTPMFLRRLEAPLKIDKNTELPAGVSVGVFTPGLHRDPTIFPNPDHFDPDRFLPENVKSRGQYAFLPFSTGPRNCIGFRFGLNEIKVMTARVLRHFKIETSDTLDSVRLFNDLVLTPERGYNFILTKRQ